MNLPDRANVPSDEQTEREHQRAERARAVWQPLTERRLTLEDVREIEANVVGFFHLLAEWDRRDRGLSGPEPAVSPADPAPPHELPGERADQTRTTAHDPV